MPLPFVSRGTLAATQRLADDYEKLWSESLAREQRWADRYEALTAKLVEATKKPDPPVLRERTRDEVIEAIIAKAGNNVEHRAHLSAWAMQQRRAGIPDDVIIPQIIDGISDDDSPDGCR